MLNPNLKRYFFHISYNGFNYRGYQRQINVTSVQQVIEESLARILREPITIHGCGRTDAKVHALQYFFHINTEIEISEKHHYQFNQVLPKDIVIHEIIEVEQDQHARFDALSRSYSYHIHTQKSPFLNTTSSFYDLQNLDFTAIRACLKLLKQYEDFRSYCKQPDKHNHTLCKFEKTELFVLDKGKKLRIDFTANRFLRGMIRILVGSILEVGKGNNSLSDFESHLISKEPLPLMKIAHPQGLYLTKITYPFLEKPILASNKLF